MSEDLDDKLRRKGAEHEVKGTKREIEGKIEKNIGDATDDLSKEASGAVKEAAGKVQKNVGEAVRKNV